MALPHANFVIVCVNIALLLGASLGNAQTSRFGPQQIIQQPDALNAVSVFAADLDGDGDQDVLSASVSDNKIAWYENTDGMGGFGPQRVITTSANGARSVFAANLWPRTSVRGFRRSGAAHDQRTRLSRSLERR